MEDRQLEEMLDEYSQPELQTNMDPGWQAQWPGLSALLVPLLALAREIAALFVPVKPRSAYRVELHRRLVADARQRQALHNLALDQAEAEARGLAPQVLSGKVWAWLNQETGGWQPDPRWMIGAAAVGSAVSLAGILAYLLRHRGRPASAA
jgi:hypothetical protein